MTLTLYGIPNCDTVKKARSWLDAKGIAHAFHDYKKLGIDEGKLVVWAESAGWDKLLNRAGTTFRKLTDAEKDGLTGSTINENKAAALMVAQPSCIKRPVLEYPGGLLVGFAAGEWEQQLGRETGA